MSAAGAGEGGAAPLAASARRVQAALDALGLGARVRELGVPARTAREAADALGVPVGAIAKSLVFRAASGAAVLVIAAGDRRVDEARVGAALGEPIGRADAAFVREASGYAIGGIPPLGHASAMTTFVDASLARFPEVWAAGGTPHAVFPIAPAALSALPGVRTIEIG
ncbi:MAG TPA: YbaK/EbsC family protein [Burkholderiaceae bacterium]|nr:YbaK/EbsC family protein [Burkholderiaceae bacterium]